jgi:hypothetical protein
MSLELEIHPLRGVGPLRFGMQLSEVAAAIGDPEQVSKNHLGQRVEFRGPLTLGYSTDGPAATLAHIGIAPAAVVPKLGDIRLFEQPDSTVIHGLLALEPKAGTYLGFLVFPALGIALTGFHDADESQRAVTLFAPGAWDKRLSKLAPFVQSN